jgi:hypothetical protein
MESHVGIIIGSGISYLGRITTFFGFSLAAAFFYLFLGLGAS